MKLRSKKLCFEDDNNFFPTGLDPAKPGFEFLPVKHLNTDNAEFVDVIHTAGGSLGFISSLGHADFFPNGGFVQPGCGSLSNLFGLSEST